MIGLSAATLRICPGLEPARDEQLPRLPGAVRPFHVELLLPLAIQQQIPPSHSRLLTE